MSLILQDFAATATIQQGRHILRYRKGRETSALLALVGLLNRGQLNLCDAVSISRAITIVRRYDAEASAATDAIDQSYIQGDSI
jgi:hypothetical protein